MATDGTTNSDPSLAWPGDDSAVKTLEDYCEKLVQNGYMQPGDIQKILTAPGANLVVDSTTADDTTTVTFSGTSGLKVYRVREPDASNAIFAASANFVYDKALDSSKAPYGDKGFIVIRKGGDAAMYRKNQATKASTGGDIKRYQNAIGVLPTPPSGGAPPTVEDATMVLTYP